MAIGARAAGCAILALMALSGLVLAAPSAPEAPASIPSETLVAEGVLRIERRWVEQPVEARSLEGLIAALRGDGSHARTRVSYEQEAELAERRDGTCSIARLRVDVDIEVRVPAWAGEAPPENVATAFERVASALRLHEEGHVALAVEEARRTTAILAGAGSFPDCRSARRFLLREQLQFERRLRWRNARYDRQTAHGAKQGAVILRPLRSRPVPSGRPLR